MKTIRIIIIIFLGLMFTYSVSVRFGVIKDYLNFCTSSERPVCVYNKYYEYNVYISKSYNFVSGKTEVIKIDTIPVDTTTVLIKH